MAIKATMGNIDYDPETGIFTWSKGLNNQWANKQAGTLETKGYRQITVGRVRYKAHRLAWYLMTGTWPGQQIDHINSNPDDNRFCNLRLASNAENKRNSGLETRNTSCFKGVSWHKDKKRWSVNVSIPGQGQTQFGYFKNLISAAYCANIHIAYYHGEFARLNQIPPEAWTHD